MTNIKDKIKSLPATREEIDWKNRVSIALPSVKGEDSKTTLFSKEDVKEWIEDFKKQYNENPQFKEEGMQIFVTNPSYLEAKEKYETAKYNYLKDAGTTESKISTKMKISEFKNQIREEILSNLQEKKKKDEEEAPEETETTTDTETTTEETPGADFGVDPKIQTLQNALKAAYDAAKDMGDEKLTTQIGNTITYFTRTHVVSDKDQVSEALKNTIKESIRRVLNERERHTYVGKYRAKDGNIYSKYKDDENYVFIKVNGELITIEGDGEIKSQDEVYDEIKAAKASTPNKYQQMSDKEFKDYMRSRFTENKQINK